MSIFIIVKTELQILTLSENQSKIFSQTTDETLFITLIGSEGQMLKIESFQEYLMSGTKTREARERLVPRAWDDLQPFFHMARQGRHCLCKHTLLSCAAVHEDIATSTGSDVKVIKFTNEPRVLPDHRAFFPRVEENLKIKYIGDAIAWFEDAFEACLWTPMEKALARNYTKPHWTKLITNFQIDLRLALLSYLGFAVIGDAQRQIRMGHALRLMKESIPLGEDPKKDGTWLILAA